MSRHGKIDSLKSQPIKLELCVLCSAASAPSLARAAGQHAAETSTRIATQTGNGRAKSRFTPPSPSPQSRSRTRSGRPEAEERRRRSGSAGSGRMISSGRDRGGLRAPQRWKRQRPTSPSSVRFAVSLVQVASPRGGCIVESISSKDCVN